VSYTTSGNTVTATLPTNKIDEIIREVDDTAVLDFSKVSRAQSVTLPRNAMQRFAAANLDVEIRLPAGTIVFNQEAAASASDKAKGTNLTATLRTVNSLSLPLAQRDKVNAGDIVFDITLVSGSENITTFGNGELTITVPYTGTLPVAVWHLTNAGVLEKVESTYNSKDGTVTFKTSHLSIYVVGRDAGSETSTTTATTTRPSVMTPIHPAGAVIQGITSNNTLVIGGESQVFSAVNINGNNWLKLRDVAALLNGTNKTFGVSFNEETNTVTIQSGLAYLELGNELQPLTGETQTAIASQQWLVVNSETVSVAAYNINGFNYLRLRDVAILLDFGVTFDDATRTVALDLNASYTE
jgi:hypothetical protein